MDLSQPQAAYELTDRLVNLRLSRDSLIRKMNFLSCSSAALRSAYLDGYITVKRLYLDLSHPFRIGRYGSVLLSRSYLFEDYGMVAILAGEDGDTF